MADPWMKFYPRDWRGDQSLRAVSIAARGLWMECLCIMHEAKPYGHLLLNGEPVEVDALARMTGASVDEVSALMAELRKAGVFSVNGKGIIFSRRMTKDHARAAKGRKYAEKRWSEATEKSGKNAGPNRSPNGNPTTQKPEARGKEEAKASSKKSGEDRKGSRIDPDWKPSDDLRQFARRHGLSESQITLEAEKFRDYWKSVAGAKGCKLDWDATWRNWVRNSRDSLPCGAGDQQPVTAESLTETEWGNTMRRWLDTGEWLADWICPPPDQPGCKAPAGMLRFAAKEAPEFADAIRQNLTEDRAA